MERSCNVASAVRKYCIELDNTPELTADDIDVYYQNSSTALHPRQPAHQSLADMLILGQNKHITVPGCAIPVNCVACALTGVLDAQVVLGGNDINACAVAVQVDDICLDVEASAAAGDGEQV